MLSRFQQCSGGSLVTVLVAADRPDTHRARAVPPLALVSRFSPGHDTLSVAEQEQCGKDGFGGTDATSSCRPGIRARGFATTLCASPATLKQTPVICRSAFQSAPVDTSTCWAAVSGCGLHALQGSLTVEACSFRSISSLSSDRSNVSPSLGWNRFCAAALRGSRVLDSEIPYAIALVHSRAGPRWRWCARPWEGGGSATSRGRPWLQG